MHNSLLEQCNTAFDNCHQKHKLIMRDTKTSSVSDMAREYMGSIVVGHRFAFVSYGMFDFELVDSPFVAGTNLFH